MQINQFLDSLYSKLRLGIKPGLERTYVLLDFLDKPQLKYDTIHVAGTNGKGYICSHLASILKESGYKVGLYTSPHLVKFNERIRVNGEMISDEDIISIWRKMEGKSDEIEASFFEITTSIAFEYFKEKEIDIAIIETGMGGRFDSTNLVDPLVSVISSIGFDHMEFLGDTIEKIAFEKAGIIKKNKPVVIGHLQDEAVKVVKEKIKETNSELFIENNNQGIINKVIELIDNKYQMNPKNIFDGINNLKINTGYFGRKELIQKDPDLLLDTAHNGEAFNYLKKNLNKNYSVLITLMQEKDPDEVFKNIRDISNELIITKTKNPRNQELEILKKSAEKFNFNSINIFDSSDEAFKFILEQNTDRLICGSFFLIGEFIEFLTRNEQSYPELKKMISL